MRIRFRQWRTRTKVYHHLKTLTAEIVVAQGGTSSSKTVSILQVLGDHAVNEAGVIITVVGQDFPNLRRGALRDFKYLIANNPVFYGLMENPETDHGPYRFKNGSVIEFATYGNAQDAKSGKRDYLFVNEANGVPFEIYFELEQRTKIRTYIDFNPTARFWVHTEVVPMARCQSFISTFLHNEFCPEKTKAQIKGYFTKWKETGQEYWRNKWRVYGLGQTGSVEGVVFPDWKMIEAFPAKTELAHFGYSVDFGFANDPMAVARCGNRNGSMRFVGQQLLYETGINAYSLDEIFLTLGITKADPIVADSANLDAINWLQKKGWNIVPADKPPGSIKQGIELVNQIGIEIVQGSVDWVKEFGAYIYKQSGGIFDKNMPVDRDNHLMDAMRMWNRYALLGQGVKPRSGPRKRSVRTY